MQVHFKVNGCTKCYSETKRYVKFCLEQNEYLQDSSEAKSYVKFHSEIHYEKFLSDPPYHMQFHSEKRRNLHFHENLGAMLYEECSKSLLFGRIELKLAFSRNVRGYIL